MAESSTSLSEAQWQSLLASAHVDEAQSNALVLNYLVVEGYKAAADAFVREAAATGSVSARDAQLVQQLSDSDVAARAAIRAAVHQGDVVRGIEQLNDLQPDLLDADSRLAYALQLQRLVELVRLGDADRAVQLARAELAPRAGLQADLLDELERGMALLAFPDAAAAADDAALPEPLRVLLRDERRVSTANQLNGAILRAQGADDESRLRLVLKTIAWCEAELKKARIVHPTLEQLLATRDNSSNK